MSDERKLFGILAPKEQEEQGSCVYRHIDGHEVFLYCVAENPDEFLATFNKDRPAEERAFCCGQVTQWLRNTEKLTLSLADQKVFVNELKIMDFTPKSEQREAITKFFNENSEIGKLIKSIVNEPTG